MSDGGSTTTLLAGFEHLGEGFRAADSDAYSVILVVGVLLALLLFVFVVQQLTKLRERWLIRSPSALFAELCRIHALNRHEKRQLKQLARSLGQPGARLFIDPSLWPAESAFAALQHKLFGEE